MKTRMISAVMAAFMLATASIGGITASAEVGTAETTETTLLNLRTKALLIWRSSVRS